MNSAFLKDSLRHVKSTLNRYLSIVAIVALGVAFFAGIKTTAPDMRQTGQDYFNQTNFMDFRLLSSVGFNKEDIQAIRSVKGISGMMPAYSADALVEIPHNNLSVKLHSIDLDANSRGTSSSINRPVLVQGRMPAKADECLADSRFIKLSGYKIGDRVKLSAGDGGSLKGTLNQQTFVIVGMANDPRYISYERGSSTVGAGQTNAFLILPKQAFSLSVYTEVYLTVKNSEAVSRFDDHYDSLLKPVASALKKTGSGRTKLRLDEIKSEAAARLDQASSGLRQAQQKLDRAQAQLAQGRNALNSGRAQLELQKKEFNARIAQARQKLDASEKDYRSGLAELAKKDAELKKSKQDARNGRALLEQNKQRYGLQGKSAAQMDEALSALKNQMAQLDPASAEYAALGQQAEGLEQLIEKQKQLDQADQAISGGETQLAAYRLKLTVSGSQLSNAKSQLETRRTQGEKKLAAAEKELDSAAAKLAEGEKSYQSMKAKAEPEMEKAKQRIADGEAKINAVKQPSWYVLDLNTNAGFIGYKEDADRIDAIGMVFPLIFFLVAALVSLTAMTRLVENDRTYIGTMKALGYSRNVIAAKYLVYAASASLIGSVLGIIVGLNLFPRVIFDAYRILYTLPDVHVGFSLRYALISAGAAIVCATLPAGVVCLQSLRTSAASLMLPKAPPAGRRILLERFTPLWKRMTFSQKVAARNLFRQKKRLLMTIIGVAGCTALIFTGFGLRDAISTLVEKQYSEIKTFDIQADLKDHLSGAELAGLKARIKDPDLKSSLFLMQKSVDVVSGSKLKSVYLTVPQGDLSGFIKLRERVGGKKLTLDDQSVIVTEKLASIYGIRKGDRIRLRNSAGVEREFRVGGITENYIFHTVYLSPALYEKTYGSKPVSNMLLCKVSGSAREKVAEDLTGLKAVSEVTKISELQSNFSKMINALQYVVAVLILSAAALAFVVLFSLTSINIDERNRELATIKVLGFYDRELAVYLYRENAVLTILGTGLGIWLGYYMERYVTLTSEVDLVMFSRDILWPSYVLSALLTLLFAAFVNLVMFRRLKNINMVSSLKSGE